MTVQLLAPVLTEATVADLFVRWNESLLTGKVEAVLANYAPGSVLLPTLLGQVCVTEEEKAAYFRDFLSRGPIGHIDERVVTVGKGFALDCGHYTFRFADGSAAQARYTFTYGWSQDNWLISSHHSSLVPATPEG